MTATAHAFANATVVDYDGDGRRDLLVPRLADGAQFQPLYTGLDVIRARTLAAATVVMSRTKTTVEFTAMSTNDYDRQGPAPSTRTATASPTSCWWNVHLWEPPAPR
ncbi:hypothetical protein V2I01_17870 [Micromonospora sp. BRA006-A]|nr:hypothetical protein [Micromonospora sp. BRA006-A]